MGSVVSVVSSLLYHTVYPLNDLVALQIQIKLLLIPRGTSRTIS